MVSFPAPWTLSPPPVFLGESLATAYRRSIPLKHARYPRRSHFKGDFVTLAAGFVFDGGVLLCTDSEVGLGNVKTDAVKTEYFAAPWGAAAFAGAGNLSLAANAVQACRRLERSSAGLNALDMIRQILAHQYKTTVWDNPLFGQDDTLPYSLLLGFRKRGQHPTLHATEENSLRQVRTYDAHGSGRDACHSVVRQIFSPRMGEREVLALAAYALAKAKQDAGGVSGKSTYIVMRNNGTMQEFKDDPYLTAVESHALWLDREAKRLFTVYANPGRPYSAFKKALIDFNGGAIFYRSGLNSGAKVNPESTRDDQSPQPPLPESPEGTDES